MQRCTPIVTGEIGKEFIGECWTYSISVCEWLFCGSAGQGHHLRVAASDLQVAGRYLRVNHKYMQVAWRLSKMRVARYGLRVARCDCQMSRDWGILWRMPMAYPWRTFVTPFS